MVLWDDHTIHILVSVDTLNYIKNFHGVTRWYFRNILILWMWFIVISCFPEILSKYFFNLFKMIITKKDVNKHNSYAYSGITLSCCAYQTISNSVFICIIIWRYLMYITIFFPNVIAVLLLEELNLVYFSEDRI